MASIDRIVDIAISISGGGIQERSFNVFLVLSKDTNLTDRVYQITSVDDVLAIDNAITDQHDLYKIAETVFRQDDPVSKFYIGKWDSINNETAAEALSRCEDYCNSTDGLEYFHSIMYQGRGESEIQDIANWVEVHGRFFVAVSDDGDIPTSSSGDFMSVMKAAEYFRTMVIAHSAAATEWIDAALLSNRLGYNPGTEAWSLVTLRGITPDAFSEAEYNFAMGKNANIYDSIRSKNLLMGGKVAGGEWVDVIRYIDYLAERLQTSTADVLIKRSNTKRYGKTPFTDKGISIIEGVIRKVLNEEVALGGLAPEERTEDDEVINSFEIHMPRITDISANQRASRVLKDIVFTARISGAIYATEIKGYLE